jgi:RNA polymerase sigma-70 factor, ECF subfamily
MAEAKVSGPELEQFRGTVLLLAQLHWDAKLKGHYDPEDLVQQTFLEAHHQWDQFNGTTEEELAAWLRKILVHNLADAIRRVRRGKRNVDLEKSLEAQMAASSNRLVNILAASQSTPSEQVAKKEQVARVADALAKLPSAQREAVVRHHLQGISLADLAKESDRTEASVAGLLRRGLAKLRELLGDQE